MQETKRAPKSRGRMFLSLLKIGTFTIGGGYAMIPIMQTEFVQRLGWLEEEEFIDIITLAQAAPGAMVINLSVYLGHMLFGFWGAALALVGSALPSFLIMGVIALFFAQLKERFSIVERMFVAVKPVVAGIIFAAAVRMVDNVGATWLNCLLLLATVAAVAALGVSPILCIAAGGALGILLMRERGKGDV
ncbi:MAG: chromate transporter [Clostridia bacterium]|nr:chromate transporter [Clostridia bacterium]